jgi:hypothetical protein
LGLRGDIIAGIFAEQFVTKSMQGCVIVDIKSARQLVNSDTNLRRALSRLLENPLATPLYFLEDFSVQLF